ncbi:PSD1 and planctomycete cytochrome C domain-containing protein [Candidatus Binatia bacterium]|jgi:hypothetical protein|nr:PSD1 and planctomycete cytochrome C domain-containing protein [Candidatus Binatia bacterium]
MLRRSTALCVLVAALVAGPCPAGARVDFEDDVRPILETRCYECHGPRQRKGDLRLTNRKDAFTPGNLGVPVIDPGSAATSFLFEAVSSSDPKQRMPKDREPLSAREIETLRRWIDEGAPWPDDTGPGTHWAYRLPVRPALPQVADRSWPRRDLDVFVLERMERAGVRPAPVAEPGVLLRRVHLDLIGMPPSPEEVAAFERDPSPAAYDRVVDELLARPAFGERWAIPWLDLARYADSTGFMSEVALTNWPYRDWVIDAINVDMPFDEFTVEQLAGDLLPNPTLAQRTATGFHRAAPLNLEAGVREEDARVFQVIDRVNTTATVWLGSTIACAQCHEHKYDPFSQEDYYRLLAFFNSTPYEAVGSDGAGGVNLVPRGPRLTLPPIERTRKQASVIGEQLLADVSAQLDDGLSGADPISEAERKQVLDAAWSADLGATLSAASTILTTRLVARDGPSWWRPWAGWWKGWYAATQAAIRAGEPRWQPLAVRAFSTSRDEGHRVLDDGSILVPDAPTDATTYVVEGTTDLPQITGFRLEALHDAALPGNGPGRANPFQPDFVLSELEVTVIDGAGEHPVALENPHATAAWRGGTAATAIDGLVETGWAYTGAALQKDQTLVASTGEPIRDARGKTLRIVLRQEAPRRSLGRFRLSVTSAAPSIVAMPVGLQGKMRDAGWSALSPEEHAVLLTLAQQSLLPGAATALEHARRAWAGLPETPEALVMEELAQPRETHVFERGDHRQPGARVEAGTPAVLPPMDASLPRNRLGLARWLVSPQNPLTARVVVNRWWADLLGRGIVATLDDFGIRGDRPSNRALLDWLAVDFVQSGWSRKHVVREIVTSATYRQSSVPTDLHLLADDPDNLLLARNPRRRLPAESIRDNALQIAGLLSPLRGGPPVYPPQPPGVWRSNGSTPARYVPSQGEDRVRRGVYTVWRRTSPYPSFLVFDAVDRTACTAKRSTSNTPLQALTLLNDEVYTEAALGFAERVLHERPAASEDERIRYAFALALARTPSDDELRTLRGVLEQRRARLASDPSATEALLGGVPSFTPEPGIARQDLAVWYGVTRVVLNLDETISRS